MKTTARRTFSRSYKTVFQGKEVTEERLHINDISFVGIPGRATKDIEFATGADAVANILDASVKTVRGELTTSTTRGIPYFSSVFGVKRNEDVVDAVAFIQNTIRNTNGVVGIKSFEYSLRSGSIAEKRRKTLVYSAEVETRFGTVSVGNAK